MPHKFTDRADWEDANMIAIDEEQLVVEDNDIYMTLSDHEHMQQGRDIDSSVNNDSSDDDIDERGENDII
jgi:hypothetical protein